MRSIAIIAGTVFLGSIALYLVFGRGHAIKNVPPKNATILIFGDSLAEGVGATEGNDLADRLGRSLGKPVLNYGRSGDTTRNALERLPEAVAEDPGLAIIILGGNDVLKQIPKEETFLNLEKIIAGFRNNGTTVALVGVRSGLIGGGRDSDFEALAEKTGALYVSDILKNIFADTRYMSDAVHPNDAGYAIIAERITPDIASLYKK